MPDDTPRSPTHSPPVEERFEGALNRSGQFWVEAKEHDTGIGWRFTVTDRETDRVYTVLIEDDDAAEAA